MPDKPREARSLDEAADAIRSVLSRDSSSSRPIIAIGGPVGSGKSTLAGMLDAMVISTDEYLPDYEGLSTHERDEPHRADLPRLASDLKLLQTLGSARIPKWCFQSHCRIGEQEITASGPIVCEGIFALHPVISHLTRLRVLVVAAQDTRWKRWERIELEGERGMGVRAAREHFDSIAEPTYDKYANLYESNLDLIVRNDNL